MIHFYNIVYNPPPMGIFTRDIIDRFAHDEGALDPVLREAFLYRATSALQHHGDGEQCHGGPFVDAFRDASPDLQRARD